MRAVWLTAIGGPEVLVAGDAPDPVPGTGQSLVDVAFANITFVETQLRATGTMPYRVEPPMIMGNGVGGTVVSVGADVDPGLVGRRVVGSTGGSGGYAEHATVDARALFDVPDELALDDAVALLADGRTATMMVEAARVRPGERVLVEAAAGGVGTLLVQLAAARGARVVAAAGGERKVALARSLGADLAVDYLRDDWAARVRADGGLDVVFDGVGGDVARSAFGLLHRGGRMVSYGLASGTWSDVSGDLARDRGVDLVRPAASPAELRAYTESALTEAVAGRLRPVIGQRFPLERAAEAHAGIEARSTVGKTLLVVA